MPRLFFKWRRRASLFVVALVAGLSSSESIAQDDAPPPFTPEVVQKLVECRGSMTDLFSYAGMLFSDHPPAWITPISDNGHSGMASLWSYQLGKPVTVFGQSIDRLSLMKNWIVVELPRAAAMAIIRQQHMERAPIAATEQYFRFVDDRKGPMRGAFAPTDDVIATAILGNRAPRKEAGTLFVGCNYSVVSKAEFLAAAKQADRMMGKAGADLHDMPNGKR